MLSPLGATTLSAAALLARALLAAWGCGETLASRLELSSPADSLLRLREGAALVRMGQTPYGGSMLHAPPLVLLLLGPLVAESPVLLPATIPFIAADLITAIALVGIARLLAANPGISAKSAKSGTSERSGNSGGNSGNSGNSGKSGNSGENSGGKSGGKSGNDANDAGDAGGGDHGRSGGSDEDQDANSGGNSAVAPLAVAALYLTNPLSIASCVACSVSGVQTAAIVGSCYGAVARKPQLAGAGLAMAIYLGGVSPALLFVPLALVLVRGVDRNAYYHANRQISERREQSNTVLTSSPWVPDPIAKVGTNVGGYTMYKKSGAVAAAGAGGDQSETEEVRQASGGDSDGMLCAKTEAVRGSDKEGSRGFGIGEAVIHLGAWTLAWGALLAWLSTAAFGDLTTMAEWSDATYGFVLSAEDLTPNLGIYWYFFTEMFDNFRAFFLFVFHAFAPFLAVPVVIRLGSTRPLFCAFVTNLLSAMFHPYPTLGDAARYLALLPLFAPQLQRMRTGFLITSGYVYVVLLSPIFWHLWIHSRVANANFFFAITLAYLVTQATLAVACVAATIAHDRRAKMRWKHRDRTYRETKGVVASRGAAEDKN